MKAIILLNGEPYLKKIDDEDAYVFCCDGAYLWAKGSVRIDETLGDFDSLGFLPDPPPKEVYPSEKNYTDGEIALFRAIERGFTEIDVYGGGGKREDHFIGNLHLLRAASVRGAKARLITNYAVIFEGEGRIDLSGNRGKTISLLPFGADVHILESEGLKYPLCDLTLTYGCARGVSNIALTDCAWVESEGKVLVFINDRPL